MGTPNLEDRALNIEVRIFSPLQVIRLAIKLTHLAQVALRECSISQAALKVALLVQVALRESSMAQAAIKLAHLAQAALRESSMEQAAIKLAHLAQAALMESSMEQAVVPKEVQILHIEHPVKCHHKVARVLPLLVLRLAHRTQETSLPNQRHQVSLQV